MHINTDISCLHIVNAQVWDDNFIGIICFSKNEHCWCCHLNTKIVFSSCYSQRWCTKGSPAWNLWVWKSLWCFSKFVCCSILLTDFWTLSDFLRRILRLFLNFWGLYSWCDSVWFEYSESQLVPLRFLSTHTVRE